MSADLMNRVLDAVRNHKERGRFVCDLFLSLPSRKEYPDYYQVIAKPVAIDTIQKGIDSGCSTAVFSSQFNTMISNAKTYNEPGSQVYKDANTLLHVFEEALAREIRIEEAAAVVETVDSIEVNGVTYRQGYYVYIKNHSDDKKPIVGQIASIYSDVNNDFYIKATWYLRPEQTFHKASTKFMEKELLKTNRTETYSANDIIRRCYVLFVKDYVRGYPKETDPNNQEDVYVCETRYNETGKASARIKQWHEKISDDSLILYETPIVPVRVASVFASAEDAKKRRIPEDEVMDIDDEEDEQPASTSHEKKQPEKKSEKVEKAAKHEKAAKQDKEPVVVEEKKSTRAKRLSSPMVFANEAAAEEKPAKIAALNIYERQYTSKHHHSASNQLQLLDNDAISKIPNSDMFDCNPDGSIRWYSTMPIDSAPRNVVVPSLKYLEWKSRQKREREEAPKPVRDPGEPLPKKPNHEDLRTKLAQIFDGLATAMLTQAFAAVQ